jgi:outer membrane protein OmpA-like peptidoglycan-associated protein
MIPEVIGFLIALFTTLATMPASDEDITGLLQERGVDARTIDRGVVIFPPNAIFETDSYEVRNFTQVRNIIEVLKLEKVKHKLAYFEGHTDSVGTNEYNYFLGLKRAAAVSALFLKQGLSPERIKVVSYGEDIPGWVEDKRVEIVLISG